MDINNEYGTLQMQQYLLPMLIDLDKFCRENDIKYSLSDGTLLGAVRHKGFIPWDDDIDLTLDRENFNKFIAAAENYLPEQYEIIFDIWIRRISRKDNPKKNAFPTEGCIDLFVFDYVPENPRKEKRQVFLLRLLQGMIKTKVIYEGFSLPKKVMLFGSHAIGKLFSRKTKQRWYDSISQWGDHENASLIARYNGSYKGVGNARYPADIISEYENIQFEGLQFMALKGWDKFLSIMYGDYMKVPEKSKRITTHEHIGQKT